MEFIEICKHAELKRDLDAPPFYCFGQFFDVWSKTCVKGMFLDSCPNEEARENQSDLK